MQSNLTCTWFEVAANKNHTFFSGRARDTGKWKNKAIFDPQEYERNALPNLLRWLTTSSRAKRKSLSKCLDKLEQEMCWNNVIWSLPVNEHSSIHCPVYVVMLLNANSFFSCFFIFLLFECSSYMGFKFRVLINFARIYFRGSLISHFFSIAKNAKLCIPIRNIIKPICASVSLCHPHTFHARFEFWQNYFNLTQRDLYSTQNVKKVSSHQRRKTTIFLNNKSSASLEILGSKKLNKQKTRYAVTGYILRVTKQGSKADHWKWSYWQGKCSN